MFIREIEAQAVVFLGGQSVLNGSYEYLFETPISLFSVHVSTRIDLDKTMVGRNYLLNGPSGRWPLKTLDRESHALFNVLQRGGIREGLLLEERRKLDLLSEFLLSGHAYKSQMLSAALNPLVYSIGSLRRGNSVKVIRKDEKDGSWLLLGDNLNLMIQERKDEIGFLYQVDEKWIFRPIFTSDSNLSDLILAAIETYKLGISNRDASIFSGFWGDFYTTGNNTHFLSIADELSARVRAQTQ